MPTKIYAVGKQSMGTGLTVTGPHTLDEAACRRNGLKAGGHRDAIVIRASSKKRAKLEAKKYWRIPA